jgi:hypothetical protein
MKGTKITLPKPIILEDPYTGEIWTEYKGKKITVDTQGLSSEMIINKLQNKFYEHYNNDR